MSEVPLTEAISTVMRRRAADTSYEKARTAYAEDVARRLAEGKISAEAPFGSAHLAIQMGEALIDTSSPAHRSERRLLIDVLAYGEHIGAPGIGALESRLVLDSIVFPHIGEALRKSGATHDGVIALENLAIETLHSRWLSLSDDAATDDFVRSMMMIIDAGSRSPEL